LAWGCLRGGAGLILVGLIGLTEGLQQQDQACDVSTAAETSSGDRRNRTQHHKQTDRQTEREREKSTSLILNSL
jgi:hypothetical protein